MKRKIERMVLEDRRGRWLFAPPSRAHSSHPTNAQTRREAKAEIDRERGHDCFGFSGCPFCMGVWDAEESE